MNSVRPEQLMEAVKDTLIEASIRFRPDQEKKYEEIIDKEQDQNARWVLEQILENARVAAESKNPLCDDTGIPQLYLEVGEEMALPKGFLLSVKEGVLQGLRSLPGRPMAVKGDDYERISQSMGLDDDSGALLPAPIQVRSVAGDKIKVTVLMLGGGPEIRGKTYRVFHKHSLETVLQEMCDWAIEGASFLGCTPCVPAFGIGRTHPEASSLMIEALKEGDFTKQDEIERRITDAINDTDIGPLGLGGRTTALGTFIKIGPQRASGVRIVSMRVGCCFDPRRATVTLP